MINNYKTTRNRGTYQIRIRGNKAAFSTRNKQAAEDASKILNFNQRYKEKTTLEASHTIQIEGFQLNLFT